MPTFALTTCRRPPSFRRGGNALFQEALREEARAAWAGRPPLAGELYARITWFHRISRTGDLDNAAKGLLDALKAVVYDDDAAIVLLLVQSVDLRGTFLLAEERWPGDLDGVVYDRLVALLNDDVSNQHIVHLEVGVYSTSRVTFGPPEV